jgi:hypothetical protein
MHAEDACVPRVSAHAFANAFPARNSCTAEIRSLLQSIKAIESGQSVITAKLEKLEGEVSLAAYKATHTLSRVSEKAVNEGALFYVKDELGNAIFCGFFTSPSVALTINHDDMFRKDPFPIVYAVDSVGRPLEFDVFSASPELDFTVLKLRSSCCASTAWFALPSFSSVDRDTPLGLVSMGVGYGKMHRMPPHIMQHRVSVVSCDDVSFLYDAPTWAGDSGAALLLFEEGLVIGMHLEVFDEKGEPYQPPSPGKKRRVEHELDGLHAAVSTTSSHGKACRALLLSHASVLAAVEAAVAGSGPMLGAGGAGGPAFN